MKKPFATFAAAAALAVAILPSVAAHAAPQSANALKVAVASVKPTTVTAKHGVVAFRLRTSGLVLDPKHLGKKNIAGHGHIQLYVDKIPSDAYSKKDLKHHWLASLSTTSFGLNLTPAVLGGMGKHTIIIALAQNDGVLYHAPTASVTVTAK